MIDKRLLKEMPETKPYIMKQVAMQWFSLLCNIVFVALLANVLSHIFYKTVNEQLLLLTTCGVILCIALRAVCVRKRAYIPMKLPVMCVSSFACGCSKSCWK